MTDAQEHPEIDPTLPEVVRRFLSLGYELESIRLDASGVWWHRDDRIENRRVAELFSRSVDRTEGGTWVLTVGRYTYPIEVEATPLFVTRFEAGDDGGLLLSLSDGSTQPLDPTSLRYVDSGGLSVPTPDPRFRARFLRPVYLAFVDRHVVEADDGFEVHIGDVETPLLPEET